MLVEAPKLLGSGVPDNQKLLTGVPVANKPLNVLLKLRAENKLLHLGDVEKNIVWLSSLPPETRQQVLKTWWGSLYEKANS